MKYTTPTNIRDIFTRLRSEHSDERHEAALSLRLNLHVLPKVGAFDNSRARGKQAIAVPRELLEYLIDRTSVCENVLNKWLKEYKRAEDLQRQVEDLKARLGEHDAGTEGEP